MAIIKKFRIKSFKKKKSIVSFKKVSLSFGNRRIINEINFDVARESQNVKYGNIKNFNESEETTHYSVADKWGNAVSVTTTINGWFGNGIVVDDSGFLLNIPFHSINY